MALIRLSTLEATADVVSGILNWVCPECGGRMGAARKSSSARVNARWTGVRFGSEFSQLDNDHIAVSSLSGAIVPSSRLYVHCRESTRKCQSDFDLSPLAIVPRTVRAVAEDVLVAQLGRDVSGDHRKIIGIVEGVGTGPGQIADFCQKLRTETLFQS